MTGQRSLPRRHPRSKNPVYVAGEAKMGGCTIQREKKSTGHQLHGHHNVLDAVLLIHCVLADTPKIAKKEKINDPSRYELGVVQGPSSA